MKASVNFNHCVGTVKPMNAVNNGPVYKARKDQNFGGTIVPYTEANIPYARTHDAAFCADYGGEHAVDISNIFPDFDADPYDPASYDFQLTDEYMQAIRLANTQVFYRLGNKIEHWSKKYGTLPPKDFTKWAVICEHIIMHMNEGWANGHHFGIEYWEIWNEPDLDTDDSPHKRCWGGTAAEFYEFYIIAAKHLKSRFPHLKIGGPACCGIREYWIRPFFTRIREENAPLDFFSWHIYANQVAPVVNWIRLARALLDEFGFTQTESILNEWNYVRGWSGEDFRYSMEAVGGLKGASFTAAVMSAAEKEAVDMLMYYDARPCGYNGLFAPYTYRLRKGYFPIKVWGEMLRMGNACECACDVPDIYVAAASDAEGGKLAMLTYYTENDAALAKSFTVALEGAPEALTVCLLDEEHDLEPVEIIYPDDGKLTLTMKPNTMIVLR